MKQSGMIYDPLRRGYFKETPEERVRQWFVSYLINSLGYPAQLMDNEVTIHHNDLVRRCDSVIYNQHLEPLGIVEYKAPEVKLTPGVFDQIVRYNMALGVKLLIVTNGKQVYACRPEGEGYHFLKAIPSWEEIK